MKKPPRYGFWLSLAVTVALIAYLCLRISFREVLSAFAGLHPGWLVLAFANALLGRYFISYQTSYAMRVYGVRYSAWQMFSITLRTLFYGSFLPGEIGAAGVKWFLISKMDGLRAETFAAMVYLRLNQLIILLGMGIVAIMIKWPFPSRALFPLAWRRLSCCFWRSCPCTHATSAPRWSSCNGVPFTDGCPRP